MYKRVRGIKTGMSEAVNCLPEEPAKNYGYITWFYTKLFFEVTKIYADTTCKQTYHVRISNLYIPHMNKTFLIELDSCSTIQYLYDKVYDCFMGLVRGEH